MKRRRKGGAGSPARLRLRRGWFGLLFILALALAGFVALLAWQGTRAPAGTPRYVALGSSFAAGIGLGPRVFGSPLVCQRSAAGYPALLARALRVELVDRTCSGATAAQVLRGGQVFQGPQVAAIDHRTRLVTITAGGNDVGYVGDLSFLAARNAGGFFGGAVGLLWGGPQAEDARDYAGVRRSLVAIIREAKRLAPQARIVVATYPAILPPRGTCARLSLTSRETAAMRSVGLRLAAATRAAAEEGGAIVVDLEALGAGHDACTAAPWVNGWRDPQGAAFHPNAAGARAAARLIAQELK